MQCVPRLFLSLSSPAQKFWCSVELLWAEVFFDGSSVAKFPCTLFFLYSPDKRVGGFAPLVVGALDEGSAFAFRRMCVC